MMRCSVAVMLLCGILVGCSYLPDKPQAPVVHDPKVYDHMVECAGQVKPSYGAKLHAMFDKKASYEVGIEAEVSSALKAFIAADYPENQRLDVYKVYVGCITGKPELTNTSNPNGKSSASSQEGKPSSMADQSSAEITPTSPK